MSVRTRISPQPAVVWPASVSAPWSPSPSKTLCEFVRPAIDRENSSLSGAAGTPRRFDAGSRRHYLAYGRTSVDSIDDLGC